MKRKLAVIDPKECDQMRAIYSHLSALREIEYLIASTSTDLKDYYYQDLKETNQVYQEWWMNISNKYNLPAYEGKDWEFDFRTNSIYVL